MPDAYFWEYKLEAEMLCLGERVKKGTFRPTLLTIPSTQATGAVRAASGREDLWALGFLEDAYLRHPQIERFVYAPRDKATDISKLPLEMEILRDARARVFVRSVNDAPPFQTLDIQLGAFRARGFGAARLTLNARPVSLARKMGELKSRLLEKEASLLGITQIAKPLYGYMFQPNPRGDEYALTGRYLRALLEKSLVCGYEFILNVRGECAEPRAA